MRKALKEQNSYWRGKVDRNTWSTTHGLVRVDQGHLIHGILACLNVDGSVVWRFGDAHIAIVVRYYVELHIGDSAWYMGNKDVDLLHLNVQHGA